MIDNYRSISKSRCGNIKCISLVNYNPEEIAVMASIQIPNWGEGIITDE